MSESSDITEAIEEEIADDVYEEDDELKADVDIRADIAESLTDSETSLADHREPAVRQDKINVSTFTAIEEFSGALAKTVVEEAILINEIQERDKLNITERAQPVTSRISSRNNVGQVRNGKSEVESSGYDPYIMQKLLRSEADPSEATIIEQMPESDRCPGMDEDDRYIKEEVERNIDDHNDQNNNEVVSCLEAGLEDNPLQTIHEDSELEIKTHRDQSEKPEGVESHHETQEETTEDNSEKKEKSIKFSKDSDGHYDTYSEGMTRLTMTEDKDESAFSSSDESEDELDCCEMTFKEKKAVVLAVRDGDIDLVELLLEKRRAHIDMLWYGETLLMVAIRMRQEQMAEFLVDNDIDLEYQRRIVERTENGLLTVHKVTARQMAFEAGMEDLVEVIDEKTNNLFDFIKPRERTIRIRRPRPPTPPTPETVSDDDLSQDPEEDGCDTERGTSQKDGTNRSRHKSRENSMSTFSDDESVHSSETKHKTVSNKTRSHAGSRDDLSQVFGPDEGYETMSPISPACVQAPNKLVHNTAGTRDYSNIRSTKSYHLLRAHTAAKKSVTYTEDRTNRTNTGDGGNSGDRVGSYSFERKRWTYCKSAPPPKNYSVESIPDSVVRYGLPFVHGLERKGVRSADETRRTNKSKHSPVSSAYDEVVKVLSSSRLLSSGGRSTGSIFPSINEKSQIYRDNAPKSLNINYIYANRGSANSAKSVKSVPMLNHYRELLPKRKLRA